MGKLIDGKWHDIWYEKDDAKGAFKRPETVFRNWVTRDGEPGKSGKGGFRAEAGRYHLYVSYACPWAHRTLIFRALKGLQDLISVSVVDPLMLEHGWEFHDRGGATVDHLFGFKLFYQIYLKAEPDYTGRVTVPVLWDKQTGTIVSNESAEIIRMFNSAFDHLTGHSTDYYPQALSSDIDDLNATLYKRVNNGVYKAGFATSQEAYEAAVYPLFETLDMLEDRLETRRYLMGDTLTEADWRLFTTVLRFDPVYVGHFKCNIRRMADYRNLGGWLRELYQMEGVAETVNMRHIKEHYYRSHTMINPTQIVPVGPEMDLTLPHGRQHLRG